MDTLHLLGVFPQDRAPELDPILEVRPYQGLVERGSMIFRVLYVKFRAIIPRTLLAFLQLSLTWWSHLRSLEIRIPRSRCRLTDVIWLPSVAYWWLRLWHPKCMTVHFEVLKGIIHLSDHSANLFISSWSCSSSSGLSTRLQSLVSSANLEMRLVIPVSMSLM